MAWRRRVQVAEFLDGLELIEPGLSWVAEWHPRNLPPTARRSTSMPPASQPRSQGSHASHETHQPRRSGGSAVVPLSDAPRRRASLSTALTATVARRPSTGIRRAPAAPRSPRHHHEGRCTAAKPNARPRGVAWTEKVLASPRCAALWADRGRVPASIIDEFDNAHR